MPDPVNPRLLAETENRLKIDEDSFEILDNPIEAEPQSTGQTAEPTLEQVSQAPAANPYALDPSDLYGSLRRLSDTDPQARNVLKSFAGRTNKADEARLAALEAELHNERLAKAALIVASVPEDQAEAMYGENEDYRKAFDLIAEQDPVDPNEARESKEWEAAIDAAFDAVEGVLPKERLDQYRYALSEGSCGGADGCPLMQGPHGMYDHDHTGREMPRLEALDFLRNALASDAQRYRTASQPPAASAPPEPQAEPVVQAQPKPRDVTPQSVAEAVQQQRLGNASLGDARPDLQGANGIPTGPGSITKQEYDQMSWDERLRRWPNEGDFERAVDAGEVLIPALNA